MNTKPGDRIRICRDRGIRFAKECGRAILSNPTLTTVDFCNLGLSELLVVSVRPGYVVTVGGLAFSSWVRVPQS